jgi:hypothetical protein
VVLELRLSGSEKILSYFINSRKEAGSIVAATLSVI